MGQRQRVYRTAVERADGKGKSLEVDELAESVVRRIVDDVLDGKQLTRIARELNAEGYLVPAQYYETVRRGSPTVQLPYDELPKDENGNRKPKWDPTPLRNMLRSKVLRGYVHYKGETIRDDDGKPIQLADPLVTLDEWEISKPPWIGLCNPGAVFAAPRRVRSRVYVSVSSAENYCTTTATRSSVTSTSTSTATTDARTATP